MIHRAMHRGLVVFMTTFALCLGAGLASSAQVSVDLELVLAVDVSGSVDEEEGKLQRFMTRRAPRRSPTCSPRRRWGWVPTRR